MASRKFLALMNKAKAGNGQAQWQLANQYLTGEDVLTNEHAAFFWCEKAALQGVLDAQAKLATMLIDGVVTNANEEQGAAWYRKAARQGHAGAQYGLAEMLMAGRGVEQNVHDAVKWYEEAARQNYPAAQYRLAQMNGEGQHVPRDEALALKLYHQAAEGGYPAAQYHLGKVYEQGKLVPQDEQNAKKWFEAAARQNPVFQTRLALKLINGTGIPANQDEGVNWLELAARSGHVNAQYHLGRHYTTPQSESGISAVTARTKATKWLTKAAEQGLPEAQFELGCLLQKRNMARNNAARWLEAAAQAGHTEAQFFLAQLYETGKHIEQDTAKAVYWYVQAAKDCYRPAQERLAEYYTDSAYLAAIINNASQNLADKTGENAELADEAIHKVAATCPRVALQLELVQAFGLRIREAMNLKPHEADCGYFLRVDWGNEGSRQRVVPIISAQQRRVLDRAKAMAPAGGSTSDPAFSQKGWTEHFYRVCRKHDISLKAGFRAGDIRKRKISLMQPAASFASQLNLTDAS